MLLLIKPPRLITLFHPLVLSVLLTACFAAPDEETKILQQMIQADPFFDARYMDLEDRNSDRNSLEYALMRELPKRVPVAVDNIKMSNFASNWVQKNAPQGLIEFCLDRNYKLQIHYGSASESLFFLTKNGDRKIFHILPTSGSGVEFLVRVAQGIQPGLIVLTGLRSQLDLFLAQFALVHFRHSGKAYSAADLSTYNFHLIDEEAYRSALFKEALVGLPIGVRKVLLGSGSVFIKAILSRKFAVRSIDFLKGLYGDQFLLPLKRDLIEEGFLGVMDWKVEDFKSLEDSKEQFLNAQDMDLFKKFQQQLVLILRQKKEHRLTQLLLVGNELAISKDAQLKSEILNKLRFEMPQGSGLDVFASLVPVLTANGKERLLFLDGVHGDSIHSLLNVLQNLGFNDYLYADAAVTVKNTIEVGELVIPETMKRDSLGNKVHLNLKKKKLMLGHSYVPVLTSSVTEDLVSPDVYHFVDTATKKGLSNALMLVGGYEQNADELKKILINREILSKLVDPILKYYGVKDILLESSDNDFGFSSLEEKLSYFNFRNGISNERSILFRYALKNFLQRHLSTSEEREEYMRSHSLMPSAEHLGSLNPMNYYLDKPFEDQDVVAHLIQVEKALEELVVFLRLSGEDSYDINLHGEFLQAMFTPLSPLQISVSGISQRSLYELMRSPFGSNEHPRRFLIKLVPVGSDYGPKLTLTQPIKKAQIEKLYIEILREHGIRRNEKGLFVWTEGEINLEHDYLRAKVNRYLQGCDAFLSLARVDFMREKSQVFSVAPWSQTRVDELTKNLREGIAKLTAEGLKIKSMLRESALLRSDSEQYMEDLNRKISAMDQFVQVFVEY